jgi:hypothetical protein
METISRARRLRITHFMDFFHVRNATLARQTSRHELACAAQARAKCGRIAG